MRHATTAWPGRSTSWGAPAPHREDGTARMEDVARRAAVEGFLALAPDGLSPVGGYPGNDDDGRTLQAGLDQGKLRVDMLSSARLLKSHKSSSGKLGVTGFCWGGGSEERRV